MTPSVKKTVPQNAYELAVALTVMEGDRFKAILPGECVAYIRRRPENEFVESTDVQNSVDVALTTNKRITAWVKKSVLYCEDLEERIARLKFMCNTAAVSKRMVKPVHCTHKRSGMPSFAQLLLDVGHLECPTVSGAGSPVSHSERSQQRRAAHSEGHRRRVGLARASQGVSLIARPKPTVCSLSRYVSSLQACRASVH